MQLTCFVQANGGHAGAPGQTNYSVTLLPVPIPPSPAENPNAGVFASGGMASLNFQNPSSATIAALPLGRRCLIEITLLDE